MLSKMDLSKSMEKKVYKDTMDELEKSLSRLQLSIRDSEIPVVIVFEGWGASGKGTHIAQLVNPMDPRYFHVYTMSKVSEDMAMRPFLWPYWTRLPARGRMAIFDKSWYRIGLPDSSVKWQISHGEMEGFYHDANAFEKHLTDDGTLIIKFFLHISREEQRRRFKELEKSPDTAWRLSPADWRQHRDYDHCQIMFENMLELTDSTGNPWHIIEADDRKYAAVKIYKTIIDRIEARLEAAQKCEPPAVRPEPFSNPCTLRALSLDKSVDDCEYRKELSAWQKQLAVWGNRLYLRRRPVVIAFEGWDAAGKGGGIKRLTEDLDPRCYEVVPISAPTAGELSHHYLWRFYNKFPKDGHFALFDRSWYGRVLVERVEKLTPEAAWRRAYQEINEMEMHWAHHGAIIVKFWLHISPEEQLERFSARQEDPSKRYKITDEDWRNRGKWEQYEEAAEEMLAKTDTIYAPWTVVESNNKKFARVKIIRTVVNAIAEALGPHE